MTTFLKYFLCLIIFLTVLITATSPTMHKQIIIVEPDTIQIITTTKTEKNTQKTETIVVNTTNTNNKTIKNTTKTKPQTQTAAPKKIKEVRTDVFTNYPAASDNVQKKKSTTVNNTKNSSKSTNTNSKNVQIQKTTTLKQKSQQSQQQAKQQTKSQPKIKEQPKPQTKTITPQEEIIAWNQWNANIRNKLLSDLAKMRNNHTIILASGTSYSYKFTVSKSRNISNIRVSASNNNAESLKVASTMESLIRSYSGSSLMTFPTGSQKDYYTVSSNISISKNIKQDSSAKASDFSEYEKIIR